MRAFVITGPRRGRGAGGRAPGRRVRARSSSTWSGPGCAAPTWSSSPARWPTCTRGTRGTRCASGTSGRARSPPSATASTRPGSAAGSRATPCSAAARCRRCRTGHQHVCENRQEVGIRGGRPGALAEQLAVPVTALHALPDTVDAVLGALGGAGRQRSAGGAGGGAGAGRPGAGARPGHDRAAGRHVRPRCRRRGAPDGSSATSRSTSPAARVRARLDRGQPPWPALRRGHRRLERRRTCLRWPSTWWSRADGSSTSGSRAARATSTPGPWRSRTSRRSAFCRASPGPRRHHRGVRERCRRPPPARRRHRRARAGRRRARRGAAGGGRPRAQDPRRSTAQLR